MWALCGHFFVMKHLIKLIVELYMATLVAKNHDFKKTHVTMRLDYVLKCRNRFRFNS